MSCLAQKAIKLIISPKKVTLFHKVVENYCLIDSQNSVMSVFCCLPRTSHMFAAWNRLVGLPWLVQLLLQE